MSGTRGSLRSVVAVAGVMALASAGLALRASQSPAPHGVHPTSPVGGAVNDEQVRAGLVKAPLAFVANTGALDPRVAFWLPGSAASTAMPKPWSRLLPPMKPA
jgi:hypothetical protein